LSWFNYSQTLNSVTTKWEDESKCYCCLKRPTGNGHFSVGYNKGYSQFSGITKSNFETDALTSWCRRNFFQIMDLKFEYENLKTPTIIIKVILWHREYFCVIKKRIALGFELSVNNLLDNIKNDYSFRIIWLASAPHLFCREYSCSP
jgi:hypothetical protein